MTLRTTRPVVKPKRTYDARRRQEAAAATRHRVTEAAEQRFLSDGYGATTVAAVAAFDVNFSFINKHDGAPLEAYDRPT